MTRQVNAIEVLINHARGCNEEGRVIFLQIKAMETHVLWWGSEAILV